MSPITVYTNKHTAHTPHTNARTDAHTPLVLWHAIHNTECTSQERVHAQNFHRILRCAISPHFYLQTTLRPSNCGSCGKSAFIIRPTCCPTLVSKSLGIRPWPCGSDDDLTRDCSYHTLVQNLYIEQRLVSTWDQQSFLMRARAFFFLSKTWCESC